MAAGFLKILPRFGQKKTLSQIIMNEDWSKLQFECAAHSKRAKVKSNLTGFYDGTYDARLLPLHQMCALNPPQKALVAVIEANPRGVWKREHTFERLPLHIACINSASEDVILTLLSFYKQAAEERDIAGRIPLHYACCNDVSVEVIKSLLEAFPEGASVRDDMGWLPVHVACSSGASLDVIKMLLCADPKTIVSKTKKQSTPLMCAKQGSSHNMAEVLTFLLQFESNFLKAKAEAFMTMGDEQKEVIVKMAHKAQTAGKNNINLGNTTSSNNMDSRVNKNDREGDLKGPTRDDSQKFLEENYQRAETRSDQPHYIKANKAYPRPSTRLENRQQRQPFKSMIRHARSIFGS